MFTVALAAGLICIAAWLYLLLAHGRFWRIQLQTTPARPLPDSAEPIAVIIAARDEAEVIGRAVTSLLRQSCADRLHVFVVDDNSTDETADVVRQAAGENQQGGSLHVIRGRPLPPGWSGKLWALHQGVEHALPLQPEFFLLTDADIEHSSDNVAELVGQAKAGGYDLASFMVKLHCRALPEKLLIPAFVFFFFMLYPPAWVRDSRRKIAGAAGGCILIRPAALHRIGGIEAIRREIIDDCALARAVKRGGGNVWMGATAETHSLRAYRSFGEIERMIARTAFNQLRHSAWLLLGAALGMLLVYVLPLALLLTGSALLTAIGAAAWLLMATAYLPMVRFYRLNPAWAITLPLSAAFYTFATVHSAMNYWRGRGGEWKGRAQDGKEQQM